MKVSRVYWYVGTAVAIIAILYVARSVYSHAEQLRVILLQPKFAISVFVAAVSYAAILELVGFGWYVLLSSVGDRKITSFLALRIFARTQIYKYLPTNVIHMVGRFVIAARYGVKKSVLSYAQLMEIVLMIVSATAIALIFSFSFLLETVEPYGITKNMTISICIIGCLAVISLVLLLVIGHFKQTKGRAIVCLMMVFACYAAFFIFNGLIVSALVYLVSGSTADLKVVVGVASVGWLLGFIVPGAPGGLGVREAVIIAGLTIIGMAPAAAAAVAVAHRLVAILADGFLFSIEYGYRKFAE